MGLKFKPNKCLILPNFYRRRREILPSILHYPGESRVAHQLKQKGTLYEPIRVRPSRVELQDLILSIVEYAFNRSKQALVKR